MLKCGVRGGEGGIQIWDSLENLEGWQAASSTNTNIVQKVNEGEKHIVQRRWIPQDNCSEKKQTNKIPLN